MADILSAMAEIKRGKKKEEKKKNKRQDEGDHNKMRWY